MSSERRVRYWIIKCNPRSYRIDGRLRDPDPELDWRVTRHQDEVAPGDIAFVGRTGEQGEGQMSRRAQRTRHT